MNLTTALYSPDEEDLTGAVEDTSAIVPAGGSVAAAAVTPGENAQGEYIADGAVDSGISTYSYTYPGALTFSNGHGGSFWINNAALASEDVSGRSGAKDSRRVGRSGELRSQRRISLEHRQPCRLHRLAVRHGQGRRYEDDRSGYV